MLQTFAGLVRLMMSGRIKHCRQVYTCLFMQPEQVAEELATGVSSTPEWKALAAHRADIEKT